jgi:hypothetical protein
MKASCQCGQLTAEVADDAQPMTIACHCTSCQKRSGSPFGMVAYYPAPEVAVSGQAKEFTRAADSGSTLTNGFCPQCGSTIYVKVARVPHLMGVTVGTISNPGFGPPELSVYEEVRHDWVAIPQGVARYERGRGNAEK